MNRSPGIQSATESIIRHGFWFIDIPRTGSSSIRAELGSLYGPPYLKGDRNDPGFRGRPLMDHLSALEMIALVGEDVWRRLFTFSVVRNPWDRAHSVYQYRRKIVRDILPHMPYGAYVRELARQKGLPPEKRDWYDGFVRSACDYLTDGRGNLLVNFVVLHETREEGLRHINEHLPRPLAGDVHLMGTRSGAASYHEAYDPATRDIIAQLYADDIRRFGYSFGEKAPARAMAVPEGMPGSSGGRGAEGAAKPALGDESLLQLAHEHHHQRWRAMAKARRCWWLVPGAVVHKIAYRAFRKKLRMAGAPLFFAHYALVDPEEIEGLLAAFYARQRDALSRKRGGRLDPYAWILASLSRRMARGGGGMPGK